MNEAYRVGLIDRIYNSSENVSITYEFAALIAKRSQVSVRGAKQMVQAILEGHTEENEEIATLVLQSFDSDDYKEGVHAFLEKRKPQFR
ncbi:enoyl-CoA hydratase-related protein [Brevibacillus choshinensis]|uniref:enoyl-CoA hydratase-related protein n=1 Tax=Brevibacillus choshinensis TaxID=54911 RepID=UPI0006EC2ECD|nr:enoyl-CoA hydratase-related protein [Brevibacillus choshinensis]